MKGQSNIIESNDISHTIQHPPMGSLSSSPDADGIRFFGTGHTIRSNYIHDITMTDVGNTDPHIDCFQTWATALSIVFEQNRCVFDETEPTNDQVAMIENDGGPVKDLIFKNNLFIGQKRGINLADHSTTSDFTGVAIVNNR